MPGRDGCGAMTHIDAAAGSLHLASASPRRHEILAALGVAHSWAGVDIDEAPRPGETPQALVCRLASAKAATARARGNRTPFILGADTIVTLDGRVFGKPGCREEALAMLLQLSGRCHTVLTAVALIGGDREWRAMSTTAVRFREILPAEARAYSESGEASGKAGGYAIQGRAGIFVASLTGSYTGVVGLPVYETANLLRDGGFELWRSQRGTAGRQGRG